MQRNITIILLVLAIPVLFSACQKDLQEPEIIPGTCLISKAIFSPERGDNGYSTLDYDDQRRIVKITMFEHLDDSLYLIRATYENNKITVIEGEVGPTYKNDTTVYILTNGKITTGTRTSTEIYPASPYSTTETTEYTYDRNDAGYLTKLTETTHVTSTVPGYTPSTDVSTYDYTYKDGNVISMVFTSQFYTSTETYEYFTDKLDMLASYNESSFDHATQPHVVNLIKKMTTTEGGVVQDTEEYSYTYDAMGKVIKVKTTGTNITEQNDIYEYKCN